MRLATLVVLVLFAFACNPEVISVVTATPTVPTSSVSEQVVPLPTVEAPIVSTAIPKTSRAVDSLPTPAIFPTRIPSPLPLSGIPTSPSLFDVKGLGISAQEAMRQLDSPFNYRRMDNGNYIAEDGPITIILLGPSHNLSAMNMIVRSPADPVTTGIMLTLFMWTATDGAVGDVEWVFDAIIAGKTKVTRNIQGYQITGERLAPGNKIGFQVKRR